jgi:coproporphyrinogen III oxidase
VSLDDRARVRRLREAARTDVALAERMRRFCAALQARLCRELERIDGAARFTRTSGQGEVTMTIENGVVYAGGHVTVCSTPEEGEGEAFEAGLTLDLRAAAPGGPSLHAALRYEGVGADRVRPEDAWFSGELRLAGDALSRADTERFLGVWEAVARRHPEVVTWPGVRRADGIAFGPLRGDPEGAFHFVREVGRALGNACLPLVRPPGARA